MLAGLVNQYYQTWNRNPSQMRNLYHQRAWINIMTPTHGYRVDPSRISEHCHMLNKITPTIISDYDNIGNKYIMTVKGYISSHHGNKTKKFIQTLVIVNKLNKYYIVSDSLVIFG